MPGKKNGKKVSKRENDNQVAENHVKVEAAPTSETKELFAPFPAATAETCANGHPKAQFWNEKSRRCRKCASEASKRSKAKNSAPKLDPALDEDSARAKLLALHTRLLELANECLTAGRP